MRKAYLINMRSPNPDVLEAIRKVWSDEYRVGLNETQVLVAHQNGGSSVYELIQNRLENQEKFHAWIVRVEATHGYESRSLWDWLEEYE